VLLLNAATGRGEECQEKWLHTVELLEDAVNGARAAAAGHGDIELVGVRGHFLQMVVLWRLKVLLVKRFVVVSVD
jgi:hypothetical protein